MRLALVVLTIAVYGNSLWSEFTRDPSLDARGRFTDRLDNLPRLFDSSYLQYSGEASYRPVRTLIGFLDTALWHGWKHGPHLTNVVLFVACVLAVFGFCRRLTGNSWAGLLGAALFAVHPVHTEVVNHPSYRTDLLVGLLVPSTWLLYKRSEGGHAWLWVPLAWLCYLLGLFSKETAVVFPILFVLLEWTESDESFQERLNPRRLLFLAGLIGLTIFFALVRFHWMQMPGEGHGTRVGGSLLHVGLADVKIMAKYLWLFIFPHPLRALYPPAAYSPHFDTRFLISLAGLLVMLGFVVYFRRARFFIFGLLWWFVSLLPVLNLEPLFNPMAERYLFLPSIGICAWLGWFAIEALHDRSRPLVISTLIVAIVAFSVATVLRNLDWRNNVTLWTATAEEVPNDARVLAHLAVAHYDRGDYAQAVHEAGRALELSRTTGVEIDSATVYFCLGRAHHKQGKITQALTDIQRAEALLPVRSDVDAAVYGSLGELYEERNDLRRAVRCYERAAALDPFQADLWRKLALCQLRLGNHLLAQHEWQKARDLNPSLPGFEEIETLGEKASAPSPTPP